jgi:hypothetical protein
MSADGASDLTYFASKNRQRIESSLKFTDKYLDNFVSWVTSKFMLAGPLPETDPTSLNRIRKIGDWFDMIPVLREWLSWQDPFRQSWFIVTRARQTPQPQIGVGWVGRPSFSSCKREIRHHIHPELAQPCSRFWSFSYICRMPDRTTSWRGARDYVLRLGLALAAP